MKRLHPSADLAPAGEAGENPFGLEYTQADKSAQPIFLLADSQLLFWKENGAPVLARARQRIDRSSPRAAYLGASNGDDPAYFEIFEAGMSEIGIEERHHVRVDPGPDDLDFLDRADLILLAGGDVALGWAAFAASGLKQILVRRYYEGAVFVGISAGAVQLGLGGWGQLGIEGPLIDTFRIIPHLVGAHEEAQEWLPLKTGVGRLGEHVRGYGLPAGGGMIYHPDHSVEPLRKPVVELRLQRGEVRQSLLFPGAVELPGASGDVN